MSPRCPRQPHFRGKQNTPGCPTQRPQPWRRSPARLVSNAPVKRLPANIPRADRIGSAAAGEGAGFDKSCNSRQITCNSCGGKARISSKMARAYVLILIIYAPHENDKPPSLQGTRIKILWGTRPALINTAALARCDGGSATFLTVSNGFPSEGKPLKRLEFALRLLDTGLKPRC